MARNEYQRVVGIAVGLLTILGIAKAANSHYAERRSAFFDSLQAERKRLNLTDWSRVNAQYPTPEITLCHAAHVAPGGTAEVAVRGKFVPGSKFLFENDVIEVVKENATATDYHATIRVASDTGPGYSPLHVFAAVSGIEASPPCPAVYIGGKYEWDFNAQNGWRIKVSSKGDPFPKDGSGPIGHYTAEFYRNNEPKPFEVLDVGLGLEGTLYGDSYGGSLEASAGSSGNQGDPAADMQQIMQKLYDPKTTDAERARLSQRMAEMQQQMMNPANMMKAQQDQQQKEAEFGCKHIQFNSNASATEGQITCGQKVGTISIKGSRRFVGQ